MGSMTTIHVDCHSCRARGPACGDCVISALLGPQLVELASQERRALEVLSEGGLLPPLRLDSPTERERRVG